MRHGESHMERDASDRDSIGGDDPGAQQQPYVEASAQLHFRSGRRVPLIRQTESSECGLACLAMVATYHGHEDDLPSLRQRFATSFKGTTLSQLIEMGQALGLASRPLRLEVTELPNLDIPCILHWDLNHFVVLTKVGKNGVVVLDPALGECKLSWAEVGRHFTGVALELSIGPNFERKKAPPPVSLRALAGSIHGLGTALLTIFLLALVLEIFALLPPQLMQMTVDQALADDDHDLLPLIGGSFILLLLMQSGVSALRTWTVMWVGTHFNLNWSGNVFQHLLKLPQAYFMKRHLGDIVSRFSAITTIQQTLTTQFVSVIIDGIMGAITLGVMFIYSPLLSLLSGMAILLYAGLRLLYFRIYRESNLNQILVNAKQQTHFMESVRGVQTLRLYNQVATRTARYLNVTADSLNTSIAVQRLNLLFNSLNELTGGIQRVGILWIGAWLALRREFSAGMLMAFIAYADQFSRRGASLVDYFIQLRLLRLQGERLADIVLVPPEAHVQGSYAGPMPEPSIRFEKVSFRYGDGEPWIVKECSFSVAAGESVAITGPSGCGKSTLARLMLGLLDPVQGTIYVGGIDIRKLGKGVVRRIAASVMQDDTLFAGSIAENISFHDDAATPEAIERAARMAALHDDVASMPMGYHSLVGDMGSSLSGGQKQRVFLARAIYRNPRLLILDEATGQLDLQNESRVNANIKELQMTKVVIAHRPETLRSADRILFCINGTIVEGGERGRQRSDQVKEAPIGQSLAVEESVATPTYAG